MTKKEPNGQRPTPVKSLFHLLRQGPAWLIRKRSAQESMPSLSQSSDLVRMLEAFLEGKGSARGTIFVRQIEGEFARLGLDEKDEFSDLQHALAMYRGFEEDIRSLTSEAAYAVKILSES